MIVFLSSYLSIHQLPFCLELKKLCNDDFVFISTFKIKEDRIALGYKDLDSEYDFVLKAYESYENKKKALKLCRDADIVIEGGAWEYVKERNKLKKPIVKISERIYKIPFKKYELPLRKIKYWYKYGRNNNYYLLCSGAFAAYDFSLTNSFINKTYKWGYFPEAKTYENIDALISEKKQNSILWTGRLIDWKHPEYAIELSKRLIKDGYDFSLFIIGNGLMEDELAEQIEKFGLKENVKLLGSMSPENVREYMEQSEIFIFTSDRQEGWGAVLNESMNSGCAVVAGNAIGSVPFMIKNGENGLIYKDGDFEDFYNNVKLLLDNRDLRENISKSAYKTVINDFSAKEVAKRFYDFSQYVLTGKDVSGLFESGICSKADIISD